MTRQRRVLAGFLAALLLIFALSAPVLAAHHSRAHHDASEEGCAICRQIDTLTNKGKELSVVLTALAAAIAWVVLPTVGFALRCPAVVVPTPIRLKVKLSD